MSSIKRKIGDVEINHQEEIHVDWKIADFFSVTSHDSPTFNFAECSWFLRIYLLDDLLGMVALCSDELRDYPVEVNYGIKKVDGTVVVICKGIIEEDKYEDECDDYNPIKLSELDQRKSELVPSGVLTITCTIKYKSKDSDQPKAQDKPKSSKLIRLDTLSANFKGLFSNKESCDATLYVMGKEFKVHKAVLIARSMVFAAAFKHPMSEKETNVINIEDCDPSSFEQFLVFLYCGKLEEVSFCSAVHLYETANKYNVEELKEFCREYVKENLTTENVGDAATLADKFDDVTLTSSVQTFFNENYNDIFETTDWESLLKHNYRLANKLLKAMPKKTISK